MNPSMTAEPTQLELVVQARDAGSSGDATAETHALLSLGSMQGIGYHTLYTLRSRGLLFSQLLDAKSPGTLTELVHDSRLGIPQGVQTELFNSRSEAKKLADKRLATLHKSSTTVLHAFESGFPSRLSKLKRPVFWLFVQGNRELLNFASVAVVGTRKPTSEGEFLADTTCYLLKGTNIATVSGLADGIDQRVHSLSLNTGIPTIGVLGTGVDRDYPRGSERLHRQIAETGGCIVTEYMPEDPPERARFVLRNRVQAGLAEVVVPVDWQLRSGTAHTVKFALEAKRSVASLATFGGTRDVHQFLISAGCPHFTIPHEAPDLLDYICRSCESHERG